MWEKEEEEVHESSSLVKPNCFCFIFILLQNASENLCVFVCQALSMLNAKLIHWNSSTTCLLLSTHQCVHTAWSMHVCAINAHKCHSSNPLSLSTILLYNVTDKKHSDDQINNSRLFCSNNELLPLLTTARSSLRKAAVCTTAAG